MSTTVETTDNRVSAIEPDWSREQTLPFQYEPSKRLLRCLREHDTLSAKPGRFIKAILFRVIILRHRFWSIVTGADIPFNSNLKGGLVMPHPNGIVIHPEAEIGPNCKLYQQVTLGIGPTPGLPRLGGNVIVGAGAKILGGVTVGDHAMIGANSVVVKDVPSSATVAGNPARITRKESSNR